MDSKPFGVKKELEEYVINEDEVCPKCGGPLKVIGKQVVRTEVEFVQAKLIVRQIVRQISASKDDVLYRLVFSC